MDPSPFLGTWIRKPKSSLSVGPRICLERHRSHWVDLDREAGSADAAAVLHDAIHEFFRHRAETCRQRLQELFRAGRTSLMIGLVVLAAAIALGDVPASLMQGSRIGEIIRESLTIGGRVSMWRPLEVFLYDWWPISQRSSLVRSVGGHARAHQVCEATGP